MWYSRWYKILLAIVSLAFCCYFRDDFKLLCKCYLFWHVTVDCVAMSFCACTEIMPPSSMESFMCSMLFWHQQIIHLRILRFFVKNTMVEQDTGNDHWCVFLCQKCKRRSCWCCLGTSRPKKKTAWSI